jgi:DNA-binding MarR family transcriptional regulator
MLRREFVNLIEQNMLIMDWLGDKMKHPGDTAGFRGCSRTQLKLLVRLNIGGRARLKDIARREGIPIANLCAAFRKLESDGLVAREIDDDDRRNTWYSVSNDGAGIANSAMEVMRGRVSDFFAMIGREDGEKLVGALRQINKILNGIKSRHI